MHALALLVLLAAPNVEPATPAVTVENVSAITALIAPPADEVRYASIGWRRTLWEAAKEAQKADKPILLWAMNGHPLGCV
ncbi:MAG: hypothetical protein JST54_14685 [Deltaproteobacteria bacterium]|nr:hypothetical protein [Deltaproteobacteria bacterium]